MSWAVFYYGGKSPFLLGLCKVIAFTFMRMLESIGSSCHIGYHRGGAVRSYWRPQRRGSAVILATLMVLIHAVTEAIIVHQPQLPHRD